jgi:hypothetical protein
VAVPCEHDNETFGFHKRQGSFKLAERLSASQDELLHGVMALLYQTGLGRESTGIVSLYLYHAWKVYGGVDVQLHAFLTSTVGGSEWLARLGHFTPGTELPPPSGPLGGGGGSA